jgi:Mg-chelatase subunit ChlD
MSDKLSVPGKTVITTGKGKDKAVVAVGPKISSRGKVMGHGNQVDVVFVFDTTGSMSDKINQLLATCIRFVDEAKNLDLDLQYALVAFGDISVQGGGDTIELVVPLTDSVEKMKKGFATIPRNNGFGNWGETCLEAIQVAFRIEHREKAVKVLVLLTDEPALEYTTTVKEIMKELARHEYLLFVIAIDEDYYKEMAKRNGGDWMEIGPETSLESILKMFNEMAKKVSEVAKEVHLLGDGSVRKYLTLKAPKKD